MRFLLFSLFASFVLGQSPETVTVLWAPSDYNIGPYPSGEAPRDLLPACPAPTADCLERASLAPLDGFALEPLLKIRFSGPVRLETLRDGIFLVYGPVRHRDGFSTYPEGQRTAINNLSWDPRTNTLYAKPDEALEHDREYFLVVNDRVRAANGQPVRPDPRFLLPIPSSLGPGVVAYTRFHTLNVVQSLLATDLGRPGSFRLEGPGVIRLSDFRRLEVRLQRTVDPAAPLVAEPFPADLETVRALGLNRLAFFSFTGPRGDTIHGHIWLPDSSPSPLPVVLIGHGLGDQRFAGPTFFANAFTGRAAVVSINAVGHGYGPASKLVLERNNGQVLEIPIPGRGVDADSNGAIDLFEGCVLAAPGNPAFIRQCLRNTALDYRKLIREIEAGVDLDGDRRPDLDSSRIQYLGQSLGAMYGAILVGLEPRIQAAVLNAGGGSALESARFSPSLRPILALYFATSYPNLTSGFLQVPDPLTARFQDVAILEDPRSGPYLEILDRVSMLESDGAPASFAPFFKQATLYGNAIKPVLFQYATGDQTVSNQGTFQLIRSAFEYGLVSAYRHDLARRDVPTLPANPHTYLAAFVELRPETLLIGQAALLQAAQFLAAPNSGVPDVNPLLRTVFTQDLFQTPASLP
jgi:hypothetical protein